MKMSFAMRIALLICIVLSQFESIAQCPPSQNQVILQANNSTSGGTFSYQVLNSQGNNLSGGNFQLGVNTIPLCLSEGCYSLVISGGAPGSFFNPADTWLISINGQTILSGSYTNTNGQFEFCNVIGCTNPYSCNYDPEAIVDDNSCSGIIGCTNPTACNYLDYATCDDGSCCFSSQCAIITVTPNENSNQLSNAQYRLNTNNTVLKGIVPPGEPWQIPFCLEDGCYSFYLVNESGDVTFSINNLFGGEIIEWTS
jgi:hypothetical protein